VGDPLSEIPDAIELVAATRALDDSAFEAAVQRHLEVLRTGSNEEVEASEDQLPRYVLDVANERFEAEMVDDTPPVDLGERWFQLRTIAPQQAFLNSTTRFNVVPAGRRSGKSECAKRRIVMKAVAPKKVRDAWVVVAAPVLSQAKRIYWRDLKRLIPSFLRRGPPAEVDLTIPLIDGTDITVSSTDEPARLEGRSITHITLDEFGDMKESVWDEHIRPALGDHEGTADFIGTPEGRNHYYDLWEYATTANDPEWAGHTWTSEMVLPPSEILSMKRGMDSVTYRQEVLASFETRSGAAYYCWSRDLHLREFKYDPSLDLIFAFDFNVEPGVAAVIQEGPEGTRIIDEVWIERESNTPRVCDQLIARWKHHRGRVLLYGDATGGNRGTAKTEGDDWTIIRRTLKRVYDEVLVRVDASNPRERMRINSMNTRLLNADDEVHMRVDPRCTNIIKDFEGVRIDPETGQIAKKKHPTLSHISDAIGYYVARRFPVKSGKGGGLDLSH
jgi:hypothetical protein